MENQQIIFNNNWNNKLSCKCFTTCRIYDKTKHIKGNKFQIILKGKNDVIDLKTATIVDMAICKPSKITNGLALIDTGYKLPEFMTILKAMYKNKLQDFDNTDFVFLFLMYDDC